MRRGLDWLYAGCAVLAGLALFGVFALIIVQVGGAFFGYAPRSADEFAGYSMAASAFLAFPYAFRRGDHIRVVLIVENLRGRPRWIADVMVMLIATYLAGYLAWFSVRLVWQSWQFNELSQGLVPLPMWIPQSAMAVGTVVFFVAVVDTAVEVMRGRRLDAGDAPSASADR